MDAGEAAPEAPVGTSTDARRLWEVLLERVGPAWDTEDEDAWDAICDEVVLPLQQLGDSGLVDDLVVAITAELPEVRCAAALVLAQYGFRLGRPFAQRVTPALATQAAVEGDEDVRRELVRGIGRSELPQWAPVLREYAADPCEWVRLVVAQDLAGLFGGDDPDEVSIWTLKGLTRDPEPEVRDWATFSLGTLCEVDTPAVRAALRARLDDTAEDTTAAHAAVGLAARHDSVVLPHLRRWLLAPADVVGNLVVEAAGLLGDPTLLPRLRELKAGGWADHDPLPGMIDDAIELLEAADEVGPGASSKGPGCSSQGPGC